MKEPRQAPPKRNEETSGFIQDSSRAPNHKSDLRAFVRTFWLSFFKNKKMTP